MTTALLNQLHDHKLTQIRAHAQKQIELWRETIAVVKKAEQESKCIIALPEELIDIVAVEKRVESIGYMNVLEIESEITRTRKQICYFAIEKLGRMHEHLQTEADDNTKSSDMKSEYSFGNAINSDAKWFHPEVILRTAFFSFVLCFVFCAIVDSFLPTTLALVLGVPISVWLGNSVALNIVRGPTPNKKEEVTPALGQKESKIDRINSAIAQIEAHRSAATI